VKESPANAAVGIVHVANEWSRLTTEFPPHSDYTTTGEVHATYSAPGRIIQADSDLVKIVVKDADVKSVAPVSVDSRYRSM
jgi:hypothetical protein